MNGKVKPGKFSTDNIVGAEQVSPGLRKLGDKVLNVFQLAVLPDRSVIEYTHKMFQAAPELYQKVNDEWHKPNDPKGYESYLFDSHLQNGTWIWKR